MVNFNLIFLQLLSVGGDATEPVLFGIIEICFILVTMLFTYMVFYLPHRAVDSSLQKRHVVFGVPN